MPTPSPSNDPVVVMLQVCQQRAATWDLLHLLTEPGDPGAWVADLPELLESLADATAWLQDSWRPAGVLLLDGLVRRARRRGEEDVVDLTREAVVAAQPTLGRLHRATGDVAALCTTELSHWEAGATDEAKARRVEQMALLVPDGPVREHARALAAARLPVWSPVAQVVAAYLLLETGR